MAASSGHWSKGSFVTAASAMHEADRQSEIRQSTADAMGVKSLSLPSSTRTPEAGGPPAPFTTWAQKRAYDAAHNPTPWQRQKAYRAKTFRKVMRGV